jgi:hypothetical protein
MDARHFGSAWHLVALSDIAALGAFETGVVALISQWHTAQILATNYTNFKR